MTSWDDVPPAPVEAAFLPLRAAGLRYDVARTGAGTSYAVFRWRTDGLAPLSCSVIWHDQAWRLTAHTPGGATVPSVTDASVAERNAALHLVRARLDPRDGTLVCDIALRTRPERLSGDDLIDLLVLLAEALELATGTSARVPTLPILSAAAAGSTTDGDARVHGDVGISWPQAGWVEVTARDRDRPWDSLARDTVLVRQLHDWAPVGKLVDAGSVAARVTALAVTGEESAVLRGAVDDAQLLLAAVQRFARPPG